MNILSIGNSFSQDSHRYLHQIAKEDGVEIKAENLCIGGCSLRTHYLNMLGDKEAYTLELNGETTGVKVAIRQALESVDWDIITLQQVSYLSAKGETYSPYIEELAKYVKKYCPHSKIFIHETWAYEAESERLKVAAGYNTPEEMLRDIQSAYLAAANVIQADGIIHSGTALQKAISLGLKNSHRDTFHASLGAGRYLLALTWYKTLTGRDIAGNTFAAFDEPVTDEERAIVTKAVDLTLQK